MKLKQVITTGIVTTVLGLAPMIASAEEGAYFGAFLGKGSIDISSSDLNKLAGSITQRAGGSAPTAVSRAERSRTCGCTSCSKLNRRR